MSMPIIKHVRPKEVFRQYLPGNEGEHSASAGQAEGMTAS